MTTNIRTYRQTDSVPAANDHLVLRLDIKPINPADQEVTPTCFRARILRESGVHLNTDEGDDWGHRLCSALIQAGVAKDIATSFRGFHDSIFEFLYIGDDDPEQIEVQRAIRSYLVGRLGHVTIG